MNMWDKEPNSSIACVNVLVSKEKPPSESQSFGRNIPRGFVFDLTAGEDW